MEDFLVSYEMKSPLLETHKQNLTEDWTRMATDVIVSWIGLWGEARMSLNYRNLYAPVHEHSFIWLIR